MQKNSIFLSITLVERFDFQYQLILKNQRIPKRHLFNNLPVLTEWSTETLANELKNDYPAFYILTNSRACTLSDARKMNTEIGQNLTAAAKRAQRDFVRIDRKEFCLI
jgi:hypothetical protein